MTAIRAAIQPAIRAAISGGYGSSSAWSPLTLFSASEVGVWYDPSDFSTMYQDSAGTTPVTAVGDPVGKILDKSGNGKHASQATAASRPILRHDGTNYYLEFDGVDDILATAAIDFTATDAISLFAGVRMVNGTQYGFVAELSVSGSSNNGVFSLVAPDAWGKYGVSSKGTVMASAITGANYPLPSTSVLTGLADISADSTIIRVNGGAEIVTTSTNQGTGNYGNYALYLGMRYASAYKFGGRLYSMIILGRTATAGEITSAESYVAGKTGVVL